MFNSIQTRYRSTRDLGVYIDGSMTMRVHLNNVLSSCYGSLRQIRSTKRSLPVHALNTLVTSLVYSRLDYCNVVFAGLPACDLHPLQSVLISVAARLITNASRRDHITPLLRERHWLPIQQRIDYKLCVMVHRCLHEPAPSYLMELITPSAVAHSRAGLRSTESRTVAVPRAHFHHLEIGRSPSQRPVLHSFNRLCVLTVSQEKSQDTSF